MPSSSIDLQQATTDKTGSLTEDEMVRILEDIARHGSNQAAQIAAIKTLREIRRAEKPPAGGFAELDGSKPRLKAV